MANFEFLAHTDIDMEEEDVENEDELYDQDVKKQKQNKETIMLVEDVDVEAEEVFNELNLLTETEDQLASKSAIKFHPDYIGWYIYLFINQILINC